MTDWRRESEQNGFQYSDEVAKYVGWLKIGQGSFGQVFRAQERIAGHVVALKKILKESAPEEVVKNTALKEVELLNRLNHTNIVDLIEVYKSESTRRNGVFSEYYLVLEFCDHDLAGIIWRKDIKLSLGEIKGVMMQILTGLSFIHSSGIMHRDLKTSNILVTKNGVVKIADFGLAKVRKAHMSTLRTRVGTLWYRAPELLLGYKHYGMAVDLWSAGCIMGEMWLKNPLLQARDARSQLVLISRLCGSINAQVWPRVIRLRFSKKNRLPQEYKRQVKECFRPFVKDPQTLKLLDALLTVNPVERLSTKAALKHKFFTNYPKPKELTGLLAQNKQSMFSYFSDVRWTGGLFPSQCKKKPRNVE